ncbi:hypothetical protein FA13DRAFT_1726382 [Coprinellus micaceus]|uniref:Uncharacterized protein n=1 Tax=Coprinellus micaceus TaxID=71717 RepID=A0A4Y7TT14_COPMI|nr:hypothetical protein FA13DRAFT_1726382 [Coprinellus micaceus]
MHSTFQRSRARPGGRAHPDISTQSTPPRGSLPCVHPPPAVLNCETLISQDTCPLIRHSNIGQTLPPACPQPRVPCSPPREKAFIKIQSLLDNKCRNVASLTQPITPTPDRRRKSMTYKPSWHVMSTNPPRPLSLLNPGRSLFSAKGAQNAFGPIPTLTRLDSILWTRLEPRIHRTASTGNYTFKDSKEEFT